MICFEWISDLWEIGEKIMYLNIQMSEKGSGNMWIKNCDLNDMFEDWW